MLTGLEKSFLVKNLELSVYLVNVQGEAIEVSFFIVRQLNIRQLCFSSGVRLLPVGGGVCQLLRADIIGDLTGT